MKTPVVTRMRTQGARRRHQWSAGKKARQDEIDKMREWIWIQREEEIQRRIDRQLKLLEIRREHYARG